MITNLMIMLLRDTPRQATSRKVGLSQDSGAVDMSVDENGVAGMSAPMRTVCFMDSEAAQPYQRVVGQPQSCLVPARYPSAGARRRRASSPGPQ
jgi:hypothetical protein